MTDYASVKTELQSLSHQVATISAAAKRGEILDITDLPQVTDTLCQMLGGLPAEQQKELAPILLSVVEELDNLSAILNKGLESVRNEMKETTSHNRAARAYTSASGGSGKK